jgi:hypothetical protein
MRRRPVRPNIYLPVVKFGVVASDWKFVLFAVFVGYTAPFLLDLKLLGIPMELLMALGAAALSIAFFNYARIGRRPYWLQHKIPALVEPPRSRAVLPADDAKKPRRPWVISGETRPGRRTVMAVRPPAVRGASLVGNLFTGSFGEPAPNAVPAPDKRGRMPVERLISYDSSGESANSLLTADSLIGEATALDALIAGENSGECEGVTSQLNIESPQFERGD